MAAVPDLCANDAHKRDLQTWWKSADCIYIFPRWNT